MENRIVDSECIPFSSIPESTRLFDDFLHRFDRVQRFYGRAPLEGELVQLDYPETRREAVAGILERQNREYQAGEQTLRNIDRLRKGAPAVVTGQQVGLFGGPLFCLLKAVTAAKTAEESGGVPVFWLAGEDHDYDEISSVQLPQADHLKKFTINAPHPDSAPVGTIILGDEVAAAVHELESIFGRSEVSEVLAATYRKGESFSSAFARFYAKVLGCLGIVFLNPLDPDLHRLAQPLYRAALERSGEINQALMARNRELEASGYHAQVKVGDTHTLCFYFEDNSRIPVRLEGDRFLVGERRLSRSALLEESERCPERFSANVLLRPVVEDYLLPTLCYVGGPSEIAYFAQVEAVYRQLDRRVTPIVPRAFATLVEPRQAKLLDRYHLRVSDIFVAPEKLQEILGARGLPAGLMQSFDSTATHLDQGLSAIRSALAELDRTLLDAAENAGSKMRYQLQGLRDKAARAETRRNSELQHHAEELSTHLFPNRGLQEREIGAAYFLLRHGAGLAEYLKQNLKYGCREHQVVELRPVAVTK
jgi:bacillithiol synthase